jgi:hypothetical protein
VTTELKPVRPPEPTPAADSMYEVVVEVPRVAPPIVAMASETSGRLPPGNEPSFSSSPAWLVTAISVPAVSKKSTNSIVNTTRAISRVNSSENAPNAAPKVGARLGGVAMIVDGTSISPTSMPPTAVARIP